MKKAYFILFIVALILLIIVSWHDEIRTIGQGNFLHNTQDKKFVERISANFRKSDLSWEIEKIQLEGNLKILGMNFFQDQKGWVITNQFLFKTFDTGKTWVKEKHNIPFGETTEVRLFNFADGSISWLIAQEFNKEKALYKIKIYETNNGGANWHLSYSEDSATLINAIFLNENEGCFIAKKFIGYSPQRFEPLVVCLSEEKRWENIADGLKDLLNPSVEKETPSIMVESFPEGIVKNANCIKIIDSKRNLFQFCDNEKSWQKVEELEDIKSRSSIVRFSDKQNGFWYLESIGGVEGTGSRLITINKQNTRRLIDLEGILTSDILLISEDNFLLCGNKNELGIILFSKDGGINWEIIYKSNSTQIFTTVFFQNNQFIWTTDKNGNLYRLSHK